MKFAALLPGKETLVLIHEEAGGASELVWTFWRREVLCLRWELNPGLYSP
jgi:hypothetical protein